MQGELIVMRYIVFFGAATELPVLPAVITITVPPLMRGAAPVVSQRDRRHPAAGPATLRCRSDLTAISSLLLPVGDGR